MNKRTFIKSVLLGIGGVFALSINKSLLAARTKKKWDGIFKLPELPYAFDALEPFVDAETMELHYTVHHGMFTEKFNSAVFEAGLTGNTAQELLKESSKYPATIRTNGGGYLNHKLFWRILTPHSDKKPSDRLLKSLNQNFGSVDAFKSDFKSAAQSVFGSGWAWLIVNKSGKLRITTTFNHDNPIMDVAPEQGIPLLCLDLCEHACSSKNKNRQEDYIDSFWNVVNWDVVSNRYEYSSKRFEV